MSAVSSAQSSLLLRTLRHELTSRPPVWFMRQAGRCLKSYRVLKSQYSFQTLLHTPELAAEVTLLPIKDLGVDAAILFSDILVIAHALGFTIEFPAQAGFNAENNPNNARVGPQITPPLKNGRINVADYPYRHDISQLQQLGETIKLIKKLAPHVPLIGFCGGPLTVFCYLFEGSGGDFAKVLRFIKQETSLFSAWMHHLTNCSIAYAELQIAHGVEVFQLFESWAGLIPSDLYCTYVLPEVVRLATAINNKAKDVPVIYFPRLFSEYYHLLPRGVFQAIGIDSHISLESARKALFSGNSALLAASAIQKLPPKERPPILQGNINPQLPLSLPPDQLSEYCHRYLTFFNDYPHWIVNLGHGVIPATPESSLKLICEQIKSFSFTPPQASPTTNTTNS